jgi:RNA polymerase sigma-70 factor (ECF subfamily)
MTEQHSDELELIEKIGSGDRAAFNTLVDRFSRRVLNLCYRLTGNKMDAEDIAQDVFIEVYRNIHRFRGESSLSTWILRIAHNKSLNYIRDNRKPGLIPMESSDSDRSIEESIPGRDSDRPDRSFEIERNAAILYDAIAELPERLGKPFSLHKLDGMPYVEIARFLGISLSAVESRIHRAKQRLRKSIVGKLGK